MVFCGAGCACQGRLGSGLGGDLQSWLRLPGWPWRWSGRRPVRRSEAKLKTKTKTKRSEDQYRDPSSEQVGEIN